MPLKSKHKEASAYALLKPYFGVSTGVNFYRSVQLVSLLSFGIAGAFVIKPWAVSKIFAPFDYLRENKELDQNIAYDKFSQGLLAIAAYTAVEVLPSLITNSLISSLEKDMSRTMLSRWLNPEIAPFHGVKNENYEVAQLAAKTLTSYISSFIHSSIGLVVTNTAQVLSVAAAIYNITLQTKDVCEESLPFPLNMSGGITAVIFSCSALYVGFNWYIKKYVNKNFDAALSLSKNAEFELNFVSNNSAQIAAFRDSAIRANDISKKIDDASYLYKKFNIFSFFTELSSYMYGFGNEYVIAMLSLPFITKLNGKFSYSENFVPIIRMSNEGMTSLMGLVYSIFSNLSYRTSVREINKLNIEMEEYERRMRETEIHVSYSDKATLQLKNLTLKAGVNGKILLEKINYDFESGIYLLTGENGTGKSSLLNAISGFHEGGKGYITRTENIFYLPQNVVFENNISLRELFINQARSQSLSVDDKKSLIVRVNDYLTEFTSLHNHLVSVTNQNSEGAQDIDFDFIGAWGGAALSGGQRQIIAVLSLIVSKNNTKLVLLDEAMSAVDKDSKVKLEVNLKDWLNRFAEKNTVLVCIDHHARKDFEGETFYDYKIFVQKDSHGSKMLLSSSDGATTNLQITHEEAQQSI